MFRRDLLRRLAVTPLAAWLTPRGLASAAGTIDDAPNAATLYRKAFEWSENLRLEPDDSALLRKSATVAIDNPRIVSLLRQARPALEAIREARAIGPCRWGTDVPMGDDLGKGHLNVFNLQVIHIACFSARRHAKAGRGREALDDVFAALTLAHRIGTGGFLFARILECGGEITAFETLGRILPGLRHDSLDDLDRRLQSLLPPEPPSAAIGPESQFILGSLRTKLGTMGPMLGEADWEELGLGDEDPPIIKRSTGGERDKLLAHLDATTLAFAELGRRLDLPRPECRKSLDEFAETERTAHPIAAAVVESAWGVRHVVDRMRANRAMTRAGLALVRDGEAAFRTVTDPFGNGPFGLERLKKGTLIRSALSDEGKPGISLVIGEPV